MNPEINNGRRKRLAVLLFSSLILFLIVNAPVSLIKVGLEKVGYLTSSASKAPFHPYQLNGTVWHGGADRVVINGQVIGGVEWDFVWSSVLTSVSWKVVLKGVPDVSASMLIGIRLDGTIIAHDIRSSFPIDSLLSFLDQDLKALSGKVRVDLPSLFFKQGDHFNVEGIVDVKGLMIGSDELGAARAEFTPNGDGTKVVLRNRGNSKVDLDLLINVEADKSYKAMGKVETEDDTSSLIKTFFAWVGKRDGSNRYRIDRKGSF